MKKEYAELLETLRQGITDCTRPLIEEIERQREINRLLTRVLAQQLTYRTLTVDSLSDLADPSDFSTPPSVSLDGEQCSPQTPDDEPGESATGRVIPDTLRDLIE